jgi:hypothetical protein
LAKGGDLGGFSIINEYLEVRSGEYFVNFFTTDDPIENNRVGGCYLATNSIISCPNTVIVRVTLHFDNIEI